MRLPGNIDVYKRYCETCSLDKFCHECKKFNFDNNNSNFCKVNNIFCLSIKLKI